MLAARNEGGSATAKVARALEDERDSVLRGRVPVACLRCWSRSLCATRAVDGGNIATSCHARAHPRVQPQSGSRQPEGWGRPRTAKEMDANARGEAPLARSRARWPSPPATRRRRLPRACGARVARSDGSTTREAPKQPRGRDATTRETCRSSRCRKAPPGRPWSRTEGPASRCCEPGSTRVRAPYWK